MNEERPHTIALSKEEVLALVKYHGSMMRRITNKLGKLALEFRTGRDLKTIHEEAKKLVESHANRGKGLLSILK